MFLFNMAPPPTTPQPLPLVPKETPDGAAKASSRCLSNSRCEVEESQAVQNVNIFLLKTAWTSCGSSSGLSGISSPASMLSSSSLSVVLLPLVADLREFPRRRSQTLKAFAEFT